MGGPLQLGASLTPDNLGATRRGARIGGAPGMTDFGCEQSAERWPLRPLIALRTAAVRVLPPGDP